MKRLIVCCMLGLAASRVQAITSYEFTGVISDKNLSDGRLNGFLGIARTAPGILEIGRNIMIRYHSYGSKLRYKLESPNFQIDDTLDFTSGVDFISFSAATTYGFSIAYFTYQFPHEISTARVCVEGESTCSFNELVPTSYKAAVSTLDSAFYSISVDGNSASLTARGGDAGSSLAVVATGVVSETEGVPESDVWAMLIWGLGIVGTVFRQDRFRGSFRTVFVNSPAAAA